MARGNDDVPPSPSLAFRGLTDQYIMLNRVYCTYFDHNYLPRGLALQAGVALAGIAVLGVMAARWRNRR